MDCLFFSLVDEQSLYQTFGSSTLGSSDQRTPHSMLLTDGLRWCISSSVLPPQQSILPAALQLLQEPLGSLPDQFLLVFISVSVTVLLFIMTVFGCSIVSLMPRRRFCTLLLIPLVIWGGLIGPSRIRTRWPGCVAAVLLSSDQP